MAGAGTSTAGKRTWLRRIGIGALVLGVVTAAPGAWFGVQALLLLGLVALLTGAIWLVCSFFTADEPMRGVSLRYLREFLPAIAAYVIIVVTVLPLAEHVDAVALKVVLALLPVVPIGFVMRAMVRFLMGCDELERQQQLQAISIAALTVGMASFAVGFLQAAGLLVLQAPLIWILPAMIAIYGLAMFWVRRRYRD